jgi:hypothetical protein
MFIATFDNYQIEGLYYARLYALPVLFAIVCKGWLFTAEKEVLMRIVKLIYILGSGFLFLAVAFYIATQVDPFL